MKRPTTNTPLQALAAMNDVQIIEASRHLAARIMTAESRSAEERASYLFELATARPPESGERERLLEVYQNSKNRYQSEPDKAAKLLSHGDSDPHEDLPQSELAAWTLVASLVLNLDEVLTRN